MPIVNPLLYWAQTVHIDDTGHIYLQQSYRHRSAHRGAGSHHTHCTDRLLRCHLSSRPSYVRSGAADNRVSERYTPSDGLFHTDGGHSLPIACVAGVETDSLRLYTLLRRAFRPAGQAWRKPRCGDGLQQESLAAHRPLSSRDRGKRQTHGLCLRTGSQAVLAVAGEGKLLIAIPLPDLFCNTYLCHRSL